MAGTWDRIHAPRTGRTCPTMQSNSEAASGGGVQCSSSSAPAARGVVVGAPLRELSIVSPLSSSSNWRPALCPRRQATGCINAMVGFTLWIFGAIGFFLFFPFFFFSLLFLSGFFPPLSVVLFTFYFSFISPLLSFNY